MKIATNNDLCVCSVCLSLVLLVFVHQSLSLITRVEHKVYVDVDVDVGQSLSLLTAPRSVIFPNCCFQRRILLSLLLFRFIINIFIVIFSIITDNKSELASVHCWCVLLLSVIKIRQMKSLSAGAFQILIILITTNLQPSSTSSNLQEFVYFQFACNFKCLTIWK